MKKALGPFLLGEGLKLKFIQILSPQAAFHAPTRKVHAGVCGSIGSHQGCLLDLTQLRSKRQEFCLAGQPARVFWVECDPLQVMPDPQAH